MNKILYPFAASCIAYSLSQYSWSAAGISAKECMQTAQSDIETAYCQILEKQGPGSLPNFHQFRQNPFKMQRLLLKNPARKADIDLPDSAGVSSTDAIPIKPTPVITAPPEVEPSLTPAAPPTPSDKASLGAMAFPSPGQPTPGGLAGCQLSETRIQCKSSDYQLQSNLKLQQLDPFVLTDENRLEFPDRQGNETIMQYLSQIYPTYIEKMLLLGLGDTTMSFTKFNAMFHETVKQGLSFKRRFRDMYELLKKERQTQAIKARYNELLPESVSNCMRLSAELIACDNVKQNWVYRKI